MLSCTRTGRTFPVPGVRSSAVILSGGERKTSNFSAGRRVHAVLLAVNFCRHGTHDHPRPSAHQPYGPQPRCKCLAQGRPRDQTTYRLALTRLPAGKLEVLRSPPLRMTVEQRTAETGDCERLCQMGARKRYFPGLGWCDMGARSWHPHNPGSQCLFDFVEATRLKESDSNEADDRQVASSS